MLDQQGIIVVTFVELIEAVVTYTKINDGGRWSVCYFPQAFPIVSDPPGIRAHNLTEADGWARRSREPSYMHCHVGPYLQEHGYLSLRICCCLWEHH